MQSIPQRIVETFELTGRGTVVAVSEPTSLPVTKPLRARINNPDGSTFEAEAWKQWLLRRTSDRVELEAYILRGITKRQIIDGATVECFLDDSVKTGNET